MLLLLAAVVVVVVVMTMVATATAAAAAAGALPDEAHAFVKTRADTQLFYWLVSHQDAAQRDDAPWLWWCQGGPGGSSTGFGQFVEIGPTMVNGSARAAAWNRVANLLFVDSPAGTGYAHVASNDALPTTEAQVVADMMVVLRRVLERFPQLSRSPFYLFGESYGGKMVSSFAVAIRDAQRRGELQLNFGGVALGDSWVSPVHYVEGWGAYLSANSQLNAAGLRAVTVAANETVAAVRAGRWRDATTAWGATEGVIEEQTCGVSFYNIGWQRSVHCGGGSGSAPALSLAARGRRAFGGDPEAGLDELMNGAAMRRRLGVPDGVRWGGQAGDLFNALSASFMRPVVASVDVLLAANVSVTVYQGTRDLICASPATRAWMATLRWPGLSAFDAAPRTPLLTAAGVNAGAVQRYKNLAYIDVYEAGHMLPYDQPEAALALLRLVASKSAA